MPMFSITSIYTASEDEENLDVMQLNIYTYKILEECNKIRYTEIMANLQTKPPIS